ncbi:MAG: putative toxin-antitoxin system toxin component, PIN family [Bryobacteraceae bacterium]
MPPRVVVDTNVFVGALIGREGHNRQVLRACLLGRIHPLMGQALFTEYQAVLSRDLYSKSPLSLGERAELFEAFLHVCTWVQVYYSWRPNLRDEGDNHVLELAIAGRASAVVTNNISDFAQGNLIFPEIQILTPAHFLKEMS